MQKDAAHLVVAVHSLSAVPAEGGLAARAGHPRTAAVANYVGAAIRAGLREYLLVEARLYVRKEAQGPSRSGAPLGIAVRTTVRLATAVLVLDEAEVGALRALLHVGLHLRVPTEYGFLEGNVAPGFTRGLQQLRKTYFDAAVVSAFDTVIRVHIRRFYEGQ